MKLLQIILILTFFLPFFPQGCENKEQQQEQEYLDSLRVADSINLVISRKSVDSRDIDSTFQNVNEKKMDTNGLVSSQPKLSNSDAIPTARESNSKSDESNDSYSQEFSKGNKILKLLLRPGKNVTGIAYVIDTFLDVINYFGITIAFLLWIVALLLRLTNNSGSITFNIVGLILFYFTGFYSTFTNTSTELWGYWVTFSFAALIIVLETVKLIRNKKIKFERSGF